jgi:hypothetical protein
MEAAAFEVVMEELVDFFVTLDPDNEVGDFERPSTFIQFNANEAADDAWTGLN